MKTLLLSLTLLTSLMTLSQTEKKYLYLENNDNGKIKKINLNSSWSLNFHIDTLNDDENSYTTYYSGDVTKMNFKSDSVYFNADACHYWSYSNTGDGSVSKSSDMDSYEDYVVPLAYYTNKRAEISITRQSKFGAVMFALGGTLAYTAFLNSVFVAPMLGLNDGKFSGYSFSRLWRGELYSAIGLSVGIPLLLIFKEKSYYFQSFSDESTWSVVEPVD